MRFKIKINISVQCTLKVAITHREKNWINFTHLSLTLDPKNTHIEESN